ncbi:MAG TPA: sugar phosphate isomerase/epimerase family protein [Verrucomicrobiae bacterium]
MSKTILERLAVCSWSLQPSTPRDLVAKLRTTGIPRVQLALGPLRKSPAVFEETQTILRQNGITIVSGMFECMGEDYSTLETIRATGGIAPDNTWPQNLANIHTHAVNADELGLRLVTFHAGFLPHDQTEPNFLKMLQRIENVAGIFAEKNISVALETGQETAQSLAIVLQKLDCPTLGVNFDPANMILYGQGDPVAALRILAPWICQVHIKDAKRTTIPGSWGREVVVGTGDVDWPGFFAALREINFTGNLVIEREAGDQRIVDVCSARKVVLKSSQAN